LGFWHLVYSQSFTSTNIFLRQLVFGIIVLALSIVLIHGQLETVSHPQLSYAAFCGGLSLVVALLGLIALFVESLEGMIMAAIDGLTAVLVLAGGIVSLFPLRSLPFSFPLPLAPASLIQLGFHDPQLTSHPGPSRRNQSRQLQRPILPQRPRRFLRPSYS
jgi:hypothetical protein